MSMLHSSNKLKQVRDSIARGSEVALAVRRALMLGAVAAAGTSVVSMPAHAQEQTAAATGDEAPTQTVTVTGSRIRRVDTETASPVYTIDNSAIQQSGVSTIGELVMQLPSVAGAATNPSVNNGGGFGESYIELRGLDAKRTVVLVDGRRLGLIGDPGSATSAVDVNQIPLAIIDHVEVLKEGAGAIYGSDAIAGVVNFITRKDVQGLEINADYGRTTADDGAHHQVNITMGEQSDKFGFMLSGRYQKQDAVLEGRRNFSKYAVYYSSGSVFNGGSSRTPTGRIYDSTLATSLGCGSHSVTKISGAPGSALTDYRCFHSSGAADDHYNYAPLNYLMTPQERGSIFAKANYKINDDVEAYSSVLFNRTHSGFQEAQLPFDSTADNVVISGNSIYNPFGTDFGGIAGQNPQAEWRLVGLGPRRSDTTSTSETVSFGVKGNILSTGWTFDLYGNYGRIDQHANISGYFFSNLLQNAVGPSFIAADGTPTCGTAANPIGGCTPINMFAVNDPALSGSFIDAQRAAFQAIGTGYNTDHVYNVKQFALDTTGKVITLPAGDMQASAGIEHRWQEGRFTADQIVIAQPPYYLQCEISQETCTGPSYKSYSNTDVYGELFAPLLKDLPAIKSLNVDLGIRWSDYTSFNAVTKGQIKVEYKPISDVLIRGTFSQIYRAPTVQDLAQAPAINSPTFIDPCNGLTAQVAASNPNYAKMCAGVPLDGSFQEPNGQVTGSLRSNPNLKPETGEVLTYGIVYDSSLVPNLSANLDFWHYTINNVLTQLDPEFSAQQCLGTGNDFYCNLFVRIQGGPQSGQITVALQPTENLGTLKTNGVDIGLKYALRHSPIGSFRFSVDVTHVNSFTNGGVEYAGTFSRQFGNDTKWRGLAAIGWGWQGFEALLTEQYIHSLVIPNGEASPLPGTQTTVPIPAIWYTNFSVGYNFPTNTRVQAGLQNAFNRQPPILYQNNVVNANTDVSTYDTLGRRWFVSFTQKF
jgi:outer membrane receptor protein involved in Fe transport